MAPCGRCKRLIVSRTLRYLVVGKVSLLRSLEWFMMVKNKSYKYYDTGLWISAIGIIGGWMGIEQYGLSLFIGIPMIVFGIVVFYIWNF